MIKLCCSQESCCKAENLTSHAGSNLQMGLCLLVKDAEHINKKKKEREKEKMFTYNEKANLASCQKGYNI